MKQPSGRKVPVVQAFAYTKYLGTLNLQFDEDGELVSSGGNPQLLDNRIAQGMNSFFLVAGIATIQVTLVDFCLLSILN